MRGGYYAEREYDMYLESGDIDELLHPTTWNTTHKETHMPERMTKAQIEQELRHNNETVKKLRQRAKDLRQMAVNALPDEPPADQSRWCIDIRFTNHGALYEYLVLRVGKKFFTTGSGSDGRFDNWGKFVAWLDEQTVEHSALIPLRSDYTVPAPLEGKGR